MFNFLCEGTGSNIGWTITLGVLIVLMIVYLILGTINRKKQQNQAMEMLNNLKVGDKVVTNAGVYGEIVSQKQTNMGKVVVIKTGEEGGKVSYLTINASVILGIDQKEDLILDENGNVIENEVAKEQVLKGTEKTQERKPEEKVEENKDGQDKEEVETKKTKKSKKANYVN